MTMREAQRNMIAFHAAAGGKIPDPSVEGLAAITAAYLADDEIDCHDALEEAIGWFFDGGRASYRHKVLPSAWQRVLRGESAVLPPGWTVQFLPR
jgi:hypothetical protein